MKRDLLRRASNVNNAGTDERISRADVSVAQERGVFCEEIG
jgi:hypothetical protein